MSGAPLSAHQGASPRVADGSLGDTSSNLSSNPKKRSCVTCRARKVRCDKASPCNHCQRAGILCVFPTPDRTPRWARRINQQAIKDAPSKAPRGSSHEGTAPLIERLHKLETLVKELSSQLHQEHEALECPGRAANYTATALAPATRPTTASSPEGGSGKSPERSAEPPDAGNAPGSTRAIDSQFGRLVVDDSSRTRYVSSGFWSRVNDELDSLRMETDPLADEESDVSDDEDAPEKSPYHAEQAATGRHAFLFGHNLGSPASSTEDRHPPPSQVPLLLAIFTRNVNTLIQIVHMPTVMKMVQDRDAGISHANEALLFGIYYATVASMEEDDVMNMLGTSKPILMQKYRFGLEHALARADFLNAPDLVLVQAYGTFLFLLRRHESPRYVWMMTGMVIRMALALGLHRDGAKLKPLSPYEIEIRRRVWWAVLCLDLRSSEDQGVDLTIAHDSFDTLTPSNINDLDLDPMSSQQPPVREGFTDMTFALYSFNACRVTRDMMRPKAGLEDIEQSLNEFWTTTTEKYLSLMVDLPDMSHWVSLMVLRLVMAKMTIILYMPELFSTPIESLPPNFRTKLFMSALEVAEINHALNAEPKCRHWRWVVQTYTQWHAIVILLIEASRRPWSPTVERAWTSLQSKWLIPTQSSMDRSLRVWIPLRKLVAQARRHRTAEIARLRNNSQAAQALEAEDARTYMPLRGGGAYEPTIANLQRNRWRQLIGTMTSTAEALPLDVNPFSGIDQQPAQVPSSVSQMPADFQPCIAPYIDSQAAAHQPSAIGGQTWPSGFEPAQQGPCSETAMNMTTLESRPPDRHSDPGFQAQREFQASGFASLDPWLWADSDPSADVFGVGADIQLDPTALKIDADMYDKVDWMDWLGTARDIEMGKLPGDAAWGGGGF